MPKIVLWHQCYLANRLRSKVGVKFKGLVKVKGQGSRLIFWSVAVDIRGSSLPSAANSNEEWSPGQSICLCICIKGISGGPRCTISIPVEAFNFWSHVLGIPLNLYIFLTAGYVYDCNTLPKISEIICFSQYVCL